MQLSNNYESKNYINLKPSFRAQRRISFLNAMNKSPSQYQGDFSSGYSHFKTVSISPRQNDLYIERLFELTTVILSAVKNLILISEHCEEN